MPLSMSMGLHSCGLRPERSSAINCKLHCLSAECINYKFLNDSDRAQTFITPLGSPKCDISLSGWYRLGGKAGNKMADSCVSRNRCGAYAAGWLSGGHPSVPDGAVGRKVCFSYTGGCCHSEARITVRNCGEFYVYYLKRAPSCYLRYCGNGLSPTPGGSKILVR